jgi:hypothetical protein
VSGKLYVRDRCNGAEAGNRSYLICSLLRGFLKVVSADNRQFRTSFLETSKLAASVFARTKIKMMDQVLLVVQESLTLSFHCKNFHGFSVLLIA